MGWSAQSVGQISTTKAEMTSTLAKGKKNWEKYDLSPYFAFMQILKIFLHCKSQDMNMMARRFEIDSRKCFMMLNKAYR